jgi:malate dehydrogenase
MTRLDHNRALAQLASKIDTHHSNIARMVIWGNHSSTQYPDIRFTQVGGQSVSGDIDQGWYRETFIPTVQQRGAAIIKARGASSAASAASAAIDHMRNWTLGTAAKDWVSMSVPSDGSYGIAPGLIYSFPCVCENGDYRIVQDLDIDAFSRERMDATEAELREERAAVEDLL